MAEVVIDIVGRDSFSGVLGNFGSIMTGIESAINLAGRAFEFFKDMAVEGLNAIADYERLTISITSLLATELLQKDMAVDMTSAYDMASDKAQEYLGWIQKIAIESPFTQEGVALAFRQALAFGFTSDEAVRLTEATLDWASATGQTEPIMTSFMRILGQIQLTGKLLGQDWNQLANIGVPVADILADHFGVTKEEIIKMRTDGLLPAEEVLEALTVWMETNFDGAAKKFTETWAGLLGTFEDLKQMGLREFFGGMFDALQPLALQLSEWLQGPGMEQLREWGAALGEFTQNLIDRIPDALAVLERLQQAFAEGDWDTIFGIIGEALSGVGEQLAGAWEVIAPVVDAFFARIFTAIENQIDAWIESGGPDRLSNSLIQSFQTTIGSPEFQSRAAQAFGTLTITIIRALSEVRWGDISLALMSSLAEAFNIDQLRASWSRVGEDIVDGIVAGLRGSWIEFAVASARFVTDLINHFKSLLGIASPSTVFMQIGKDIIQGLINGITSMFPGLTSLMGNVFNLLTGDSGGRTGGASAEFAGFGSGTITGYSPGGGLASTTLSAASVVNNFYAPVYFGDMSQLGYDCPSPHPLLAATAGGVGGR